MQPPRSKMNLENALHAAADECLEGLHGNGEVRKYNLKQIGFSDYQIVRIQRIVNMKISLAINKYAKKMRF